VVVSTRAGDESAESAVASGTPGITFVWIPAGTFQMGSTVGYPGERPVHTVTVCEGFWMSEYEITQSQ
jgi:formylglycine-generating enzyme required for sulfatase activity